MIGKERRERLGRMQCYFQKDPTDNLERDVLKGRWLFLYSNKVCQKLFDEAFQNDGLDENSMFRHLSF